MHTSTSTENSIAPETQELAWELQQERPDRQRISYLLEQYADLKAAMGLAGVAENYLEKNPALRPLKLRKYLQTGSV